MTDKEIIIDGVNVTECDFICVEDDYCSYSGITRAYKGECGCSDGEMCKNHPECFYKRGLKQLQRKEQECEELRKRLKAEIHLGNNYKKDFAEQVTEAQRYKQALEKIKEIINHCKEQDICAFCKYSETCEDKLDCSYDNNNLILTILGEVKNG